MKSTSARSVLSSDGVSIGFVTTGSGPGLLLVHGGMTSSARWGPLLSALGDHVEVTAMDRRGRGSSGDTDVYSLEREYDDVAAVVEHLAIRHGGPIDVLGHSYGAVCALGAAARGARVRRLALNEPPGPQAAPPEWTARVTKLVRDGQPGRAMFSFLTEVVGLTPEQVMALRDANAAEDVLPIVMHTLSREATALASVDLDAISHGVTVPVAFLLGESSPVWAKTITHHLAGRLSRSKVVELPGVGHEAVETAPSLVASALERFLR